MNSIEDFKESFDARVDDHRRKLQAPVEHPVEPYKRALKTARRLWNELIEPRMAYVIDRYFNKAAVTMLEIGDAGATIGEKIIFEREGKGPFGFILSLIPSESGISAHAEVSVKPSGPAPLANLRVNPDNPDEEALESWLDEQLFFAVVASERGGVLNSEYSWV
jgi:hypothetical protein